MEPTAQHDRGWGQVSAQQRRGRRSCSGSAGGWVQRVLTCDVGPHVVLVECAGPALPSRVPRLRHLLGRPQRLPRLLTCRGRLTAGIVRPDDVHSRRQRRVLRHGLADVPRAVVAHDAGGEAGGLDGGGEGDDVVGGVVALVPDAHVVDSQVVHGAGALQPGEGVADGGVGEGGGSALANPGGEAPAEGVEEDGRVAALGLAHEPPAQSRGSRGGGVRTDAVGSDGVGVQEASPLVASLVVLVVRVVHVGRLGALGGLRVTSDLHLAAAHSAALISLIASMLALTTALVHGGWTLSRWREAPKPGRKR